jgi:hydroxyethylthiazole kinase-like uncharacterized protein yjeF
MLEGNKAETTITSREMRALDMNAEYFGVSRLQMMENAGCNIALEVASRFKPDKRVAVVCGVGGNGGDGFVAARHLLANGFKVAVFLAGKPKEICSHEALANWKALQFLKEKLLINEVHDTALIPEINAEIVIDALLGTGTTGKLRPPVLQLVQRINETNAFRIAIDVPTGIDADTGEILGEAVKANVTITFHRVKTGLENAKEHAGETIIKGIGVPKEFENFAGPGDVSFITKQRPTHSHKGDFGRVLIVGGSEVFSGAPTLVALAALRTGVDLAYVAAPERTAYAISSLSPDLITIKLDGEHLNPRNVSVLKSYLESANAVVLGPGLGLHTETRDAVKTLVGEVEGAGKPLLLDADGLKAFAEFKRPLKVPSVLTPHAAEYTVLTGRKLSDDLDERVSDVQKAAAELSAVVILKGYVDIISDGSRFKLNFTGNPGMTVGGTGDVLSGIVGAFLAQEADPFEAAVAGAFINGAAGDFVCAEKGYHMVSTDLIDRIPRVMDDPMSHLKVRETGAGTG